jgi:hypothetical protein
VLALDIHFPWFQPHDLCCISSADPLPHRELVTEDFTRSFVLTGQHNVMAMYNKNQTVIQSSVCSLACLNETHIMMAKHKREAMLNLGSKEAEIIQMSLISPLQ